MCLDIEAVLSIPELLPFDTLRLEPGANGREVRLAVGERPSCNQLLGFVERRWDRRQLPVEIRAGLYRVQQARSVVVRPRTHGGAHGSTTGFERVLCGMLDRVDRKIDVE